MAEMIESALLETLTVADKTVEFRFERPTTWTFEPGQHLELVLPELVHPDDKGNQRSFSIASIPSDPYLAITTRLRDSGFKQTLGTLRLGAKVQIGGPYGSFLLHEDTTKPAAFMGGGIGITPFLSLLRWNETHPTGHEYTLLYSNHDRRSMSYHPYLNELGTQEWFDYHPTLTDEAGGEWPGHQGRITTTFVRETVKDPLASVWYLAGPPSFVVAMQHLLNAMGVSRDHIKSEDFSGYD